MRVTAIRTICGSRMHDRHEQWITSIYRTVKADVCVVIIETDSGAFGIGEACAYGNPRLIAQWVEWLAPTIVGCSIDEAPAVPRPVGTSMAFDMPSAHDFAAAAIDTALWDLRAKAVDLQLRHLLAESPAPDVEVYASGGVRYDWRDNPSTLIDDAAQYVADGYKHIKVRVGTEWTWDGATPDTFLRLFGQLRRELGDSVGVAVDGNCRLNRQDAYSVAKGLQELGASWFEEPLDKWDVEGYAELAAKLELPITGGESFTTLAQFRPFLEAGSFDVVQPDVGMCGVTEMMRIGNMARRYGVDVMPHSWHNGLMGVASAHVIAALPNGMMLEECMVQGPLKWAILQGGSPVKDGRLDFGDKPGLGVDLATDIEEAYPYVEGHYSVVVTR